MPTARGGEHCRPAPCPSQRPAWPVSGTPLTVVLGHQRCGAVSAAYEALREGRPLPGNLQAIEQALRPAYEQIARESHADPVEAMTRAQVRLTADGRARGPRQRKGPPVGVNRRALTCVLPVWAILGSNQ
ncbi:carbonic anhydrase [Planomonospora sphaerica]|uniref:carbonic anhydrase n=1 Tax=Planomonospora sphaerica TaxID=161355 RepID=UPI000A039243